MEKKNLWGVYDEATQKKVQEVNEVYKSYLDEGKTERECTRLAIRLAEEKGYKNLADLVKEGTKVTAGDKVYAAYLDKAIVLFEIGSEPIENGMNILGAHIDSPRIDIKQQPLYEDEGFAYLDTHYYGGVKKYQWLVMPLALHGIIVKKDGTKINITIGENDKDPVFAISDILPHLGKEQREKTVDKFVNGESFDLLFGNSALAGEEKDPIKAHVLKLLEESYGIEEDDFMSAELELVPAGKARDCGLDRSMVMAYGHDDRVCAFTSLMAILEEKTIKRTSCCILIDKEEIGSTGASGMTSRFFENRVADLMYLMGEESNIKVRHALENSKMLSSDVSAGYDPMFKSAYEKKNSAFLAQGVVFNKYTGSGGKGGSNDADPEYIAELRNMMDNSGVHYQTAELGAVDVGGGGTIAYLMAVYGMKVIDSGVAVISMHAPWEIVSKADVYEAYRCYKVFLEQA